MAEGGRLPDAMTATRLLAKRAGSRQLSLIVFAGDAYVASALTSDISAVDQTIADLGIETVPDDGSRPERALALALRIIEDAEIAFGDVVLVTDGGGIGPEAQSEAVKLARAGVPLSTLYIPSSKAGDPLKLASLAETGGGASAQLRDPFPVAEALDQGFNRRLAATDYAALMRVDYGRYLLVLALLPALALFRRQA